MIDYTITAVLRETVSTGYNVFMAKLILIRHGESTWNAENRFTGWTDVGLSEKGVIEAENAADFLNDSGISFDIVFTSLLKRAIKTAWIAMEKMDLMWVPVERKWRLNERHYGALQGLDKKETADKHGARQVQIWRRSYDIAPPALSKDDVRYPAREKKYSFLEPDEIPVTESLKDTFVRVMPCWHNEILPELSSGKNVMISAHGNSLRALLKHLDGISDEDIVSLEIPTGKPIIREI